MRLFTLLFLALFIGTVTSCGGDDEVQKEGNCMTATVDGAAFTATTTTATALTTTIEWGSNLDQETKILTIIGTIPSLTSETETITLTFGCSELTSDLDYVDTDEECGIGMSYNLTSLTDPNASIVVNSTAGNIQVEEVSAEKIKGTFTFSGADQNGTEYTITDGFFDTTIN